MYPIPKKYFVLETNKYNTYIYCFTSVPVLEKIHKKYTVNKLINII
jgi:hypothetical protein